MSMQNQLYMRITRALLHLLGTLCADNDVNTWTSDTISSGQPSKKALVYCPTDEMVADAMTKPASKVKLRAFSEVMFGSSV